MRKGDILMKGLYRDVLKKLFENNREFRNERDSNTFDPFKERQTPRYTFLTCSDSRIPIMDSLPENDCFCIRNIGNQIETSEGSITYGVSVLETPVLVIMGHSRCGAVAGALGGESTGFTPIDTELRTLKLEAKDLKEGILENIHRQVSKAQSVFSERIKNEKLTLVGALYDFAGDWGAPGMLYLVNVNGIYDRHQLRSDYQSLIPGAHFLEE